MLGIVARAHRPAHRDHAVELAPVRHCLAGVELDRDRLRPAVCNHLREHPGVLAGDVLEDEEAHRSVTGDRQGFPDVASSASEPRTGWSRCWLNSTTSPFVASIRITVARCVEALSVGTDGRERDDPVRVPVEVLPQKPDLGVLGREVDERGGTRERLLLGDLDLRLHAASRDDEGEHEHRGDDRDARPGRRAPRSRRALARGPSDGGHALIMRTWLRGSGGTRRRCRCRAR